MASFALALGESAVSYAFPQLGVAVKGMRYARMGYSVAKVAICYLSGDVVGGTATALAAAMNCEQRRDTCISMCAGGGDHMGAASCVTGCQLAYWACIAMRK